ncbi:hypothetical protein FF098_007755 [Parvularcula flava]|uniref:Uncharacterized protein n=1 Tax=Aquisalinus luteolus TaxID=1566827 RepID=A0A8J3A1Z3_9PROT|nr:hypothetical protein [Aquisalinus luteolus]NHK27792.1 hypothetical protein [Aquisalinus luteolus]GGH96516.1 hypothetical protein GCM10011355_15600 [Aquisalinus luteolus]
MIRLFKCAVLAASLLASQAFAAPAEIQTAYNTMRGCEGTVDGSIALANRILTTARSQGKATTVSALENSIASGQKLKDTIEAGKPAINWANPNIDVVAGNTAYNTAYARFSAYFSQDTSTQYYFWRANGAADTARCTAAYKVLYDDFQAKKAAAESRQ